MARTEKDDNKPVEMIVVRPMRWRMADGEVVSVKFGDKISAPAFRERDGLPSARFLEYTRKAARTLKDAKEMLGELAAEGYQVPGAPEAQGAPDGH